MKPSPPGRLPIPLGKPELGAGPIGEHSDFERAGVGERLKLTRDAEQDRRSGDHRQLFSTDRRDIHLDEGGAITYRTKLQLSFKYEREH